jgi:hypothetical protein
MTEQRSLYGLGTTLSVLKRFVFHFPVCVFDYAICNYEFILMYSLGKCFLNVTSGKLVIKFNYLHNYLIVCQCSCSYTFCSLESRFVYFETLARYCSQ